MKLLTKQKETQETQKINFSSVGRAGKDRQGLWEGHVHTAIF